MSDQSSGHGPKPIVKLTGTDGNAYSILAQCQRAANKSQ